MCSCGLVQRIHLDDPTTVATNPFILTVRRKLIGESILSVSQQWCERSVQMKCSLYLRLGVIAFLLRIRHVACISFNVNISKMSDSEPAQDLKLASILLSDDQTLNSFFSCRPVPRMVVLGGIGGCMASRPDGRWILCF